MRRLGSYPAIGTLAVVFHLAGCVTPPPPERVLEASIAPSAGISVKVDGEERDFESAIVRLCAEGLPQRLELLLTNESADCPERFTDGPAGLPRSLGSTCEELHLRVRDFEPGVARAASGSSAAVLSYWRYDEPPLHLSTGSGGETGSSGEITVHELGATAGDSYRVRVSLSIEGESRLEAAVALELEPSFCAAASG